MRPVVLIACLAVSGWLQAGEPADVEKLLAGLAGYKDGQSRAALVQLTRVVAEASEDAEQAQPLAKRLAALLEDPKASREAKDFVDARGRRIIALGPCNEWGEGSYIEPCAEYGFEMK